MRRPRVGVGGLWHETNTYGPRPADLAAFEAFELVEGAALLDRHRGTRSVIGGFLDGAEHEIVPTFSAGAWPSGPAPRAVVLSLLDRLTDQLAAAGPLEGMLLNLHGAMVADEMPDVEAEVLRRARAVLGDVPIAAVLDLHANPSVHLVELCDIVISYDTYPHVDMWERGVEAAHLLGASLSGRRLRTIIGKTPILTCPLAQDTSMEPMRGLLARAKDRGVRAGVARVSLSAGFAYSDVERAGISTLVVCDDSALPAARVVVQETIRDVEDNAKAFAIRRDKPEAAVAAALRVSDGPVVLADLADNVGGGSAGDGTALLSQLLRQRAPDAVVIIADAQVAEQAQHVGLGGVIEVEVGGKSDNLHGEPVLVTGQVLALSDGEYTTSGSWMTGHAFDMGPTALLRVDGVRIAVTTRPTPPFHREQLTSLGVDPGLVAVLVAKGAVAWRAAYPDARAVIEVDTPGACQVDIAALPRKRHPQRIIWPAEAQPARPAAPASGDHPTPARDEHGD